MRTAAPLPLESRRIHFKYPSGGGREGRSHSNKPHHDGGSLSFFPYPAGQFSSTSVQKAARQRNWKRGKRERGGVHFMEMAPPKRREKEGRVIRPTSLCFYTGTTESFFLASSFLLLLLPLVVPSFSAASPNRDFSCNNPVIVFFLLLLLFLSPSLPPLPLL